MLNARAIAVQGYGYGARSIAGRGFVESGGGLHMPLARLRRARPMQAYVEPDESAVQLLDRLRVEQGENRFPPLAPKTPEIGLRPGEIGLPLITAAPENAIDLVAAYAREAGLPAENLLLLKRQMKIRENQNRALILLALLEP